MDCLRYERGAISPDLLFLLTTFSSFLLFFFFGVSYKRNLGTIYNYKRRLHNNQDYPYRDRLGAFMERLFHRLNRCLQEQCSGESPFGSEKWHHLGHKQTSPSNLKETDTDAWQTYAIAWNTSIARPKATPATGTAKTDLISVAISRDHCGTRRLRIEGHQQESTAGIQATRSGLPGC